MTKYTKQIIAAVVGSIFLGFLIALILPKFTSSQTAQTQSSPTALHEVPAFAPTPTPLPAVIDSNSNLSAETSKLTPEDFSSDYTNLKKSADSL